MTIHNVLPWDNVFRDYGIEHYSEGVTLVQSGDMFGTDTSRFPFSGFDDFRAKYKEKYSADTTMTDDQITVLLMSQDDDDEDPADSSWFIDRAQAAQDYLTGEECNIIFDDLAKAKAA